MKIVITILHIVLLQLLQQFYTESLTYQNLKITEKAFKQLQSKLWVVQGYKFSKYDSKIDQVVKLDLEQYYHPDTLLEDLHCYRFSQDTARQSYRSNCYLRTQNLQNESISVYDILSHIKYLSIWYQKSNSTNGINVKMMSRQSVFSYRLSMYLPQMPKKTLNQLNKANYSNFLKKKGASLQCLEDIEMIPQSYSLNDKTQCLLAFDELTYQNLRQKQSKKFVYKTNDHMGMGLSLVDSAIYINLIQQYKGGLLCGLIRNEIMIQEITQNPMLIKERKIELRIWILIVNGNPTILYVYDHLQLISCYEPYDEQQMDEQNFICNGAVIKKYIHQDHEHNETTNFSVNDIHLNWKMKRLNKYFIKQGWTNDSLWWRNHLLPQLKIKIAYFMKFNLPDIQNDPRISSLYAFDASINQNGQVRLLDFNTMPNLVGYSRYSWELQYKMHQNTILVLQEYQKLRQYRLKNVIKEMTHFSKKSKQKIDYSEKLYQASLTQPIKNETLHSFHYIDPKVVFANCKEYDDQLS